MKSDVSFLEVRCLNKFYGRNRVLSDISFEIGEGELVALLGPNGAGKSTLLHIIAGSLSPTQGQILFQGRDIEANPWALQCSLGFVPEIPPLYYDMNVKAYLHYIGRLKGIPAVKVAEEVQRVLERAGLQSQQNKQIDHLSKGYKKRVVIGQALLGRPRLILFDEPTTGLDIQQVAYFRNLLTTLRGKTTIILCTHIFSDLMSLCTRVLILAQGKLVQDAYLDELTALLKRSWLVQGDSLNKPEVIRAMEEHRAFTVLSEEVSASLIISHDPSQLNSSEVVGQVQRLCGSQVQCKPIEPSLEQVYRLSLFFNSWHTFKARERAEGIQP